MRQGLPPMKVAKGAAGLGVIIDDHSDDSLIGTVR